MGLYSERSGHGAMGYEPTGSHDRPDTYITVLYPFERYEIEVQLTSDGRFLGITEVRVNKSFLSHRQKAATRGFHDVEEFYPE